MRLLETFRKFLPPLTDEQRAGLEADIKGNGCLAPLIVWGDTLIDGYHRYDICQRHGIKFKTVALQFKDKMEASLWVFEHHKNRRNMTAYAIAEKALIFEPMFRAKAKEHQRASGGAVPAMLPEPPIETREKLAKIAETSPRTMAKVMEIAKKATPEQKQALRQRDGPSINEVYVGLKKQEGRERQFASAEAPPLPKGVFGCIVIDPPWPYGTEYDPEKRRAASPYPEISLDEIKAIPIPAADDCILFLWTTHKFMRHSFEILDTWQFRDVAVITWVKDRIGLGSWLRSQSEFCIMAVKGKPRINLTNQSTVINGPMREHSRKPDEFYAMVESLIPNSKSEYIGIDYYARQSRPKWIAYGNEADKFTKSE